jgi:dihydrofolate synthase / folylpolyglutamate synthase
MTYAQALDFLYSRLPMYQRIGSAAYKKDLTNTIALLDALGNPHVGLKCVHVAGTNGKGSTSHALASILQEAGYKTGLYTSPHLKNFTERIRINGCELTEDYVVSFVRNNKSTIEQINPSFFEVTVAMAFDYFKKVKVDVAVIEVGLGGRLDSTNVVSPEVSVITNIGFDHMDLLGNTLQEIAREKAGIIKPGIPVVVSERQPEVDEVFIETADRNQSALIFSGIDVEDGGLEEMHRIFKVNGKIFLTDILPGYFLKNVPGILESVEVLKSSGWHISNFAVEAGFMGIAKNTGLKGRWQVLKKNPTVVADVSHNAPGIAELIKQLAQLKFGQLHVVYGAVNDKDVGAILYLFPGTAKFYFTQSSVPRSMPVDELASLAQLAGIAGEKFVNVNDAVAQAKAVAAPDDLILITGSTFVVAELAEL